MISRLPYLRRSVAGLITRRQFLLGSGAVALSPLRALLTNPLHAEELAAIDVAYAGSMGSMMEGPLKTAVANNLQLDMRGRAQGSSALAQLIVGGSIRPDVFIPITPAPMLIVMRAGKTETAYPIAHTEMVIAYSPKSRFAPELAAAAQGKKNWWEILQQPGLRFGRTDPVTDPQGRNIIFTMMLASRMYKQPDLVEKVLGPVINERQIFTEPTVQARLQTGELDAASAYKIQPGPFNLPYIPLPQEINLSGKNVESDHPDVTLTVGGKTYRPEPLIYYATALRGAPNPKGAEQFMRWLREEQAQAIFREYKYDPPGGASALHA